MYSKKIVFLYPSLAPYFTYALQEAAKNKDILFHVVFEPTSHEAPLQNLEKDLDNLKFYTYQDIARQGFSWFKHIKPDLVLCSGWKNKIYLYWVLRIKINGIRTGVLFDAPWKNTIKQNIIANLFKFGLKFLFDWAWVIGKPQRTFAQKMGFIDQRILEGFYIADAHLFKPKADEKVHEKKILLFIGRYVKEKGLPMLWHAFLEAKRITQDQDWQLHCLGTGYLWESKVLNKDIVHFGFVQPEDIPAIAGQSTAFILPSNEENWGMVLHEMACMGLPLICSDAVFAKTAFLQDNGFVFESQNQESLTKILIQLFQSTRDERHAMGQKSVELAKTYTIEKWQESLQKMLSLR